MPIDYDDALLVCRDLVSGDDAEELLGWLQGRPTAKVDLRDCSHLHPATLQVLLAAAVQIQAWPQEPSLRSWLEPLWPASPT